MAFSVAVPITAVCLVFLIVLIYVILPNVRYNAAVSLMKNGQYNEAIEAFEALNGYRDSEKQIDNCYIGKYGEEKWNIIRNIKAGDTYLFGSYEQDNNPSDGREAIEWAVLEKNGTALLLVSKHALDCRPYNAEYTDISWEECSLRKWMNDPFFDGAFTAEEQAQILDTAVSDPDTETTDKVFLLSIAEAEKYFSSDTARQCTPTEYASANGAYADPGSGTCCWWLRSSGSTRSYAAYVISDGSVDPVGNDVNSANDTVRPALWIDPLA